MHDFDSLNSLIGTPDMLARGKRYETFEPSADFKPGRKS